jgi:hypothetical protein
MADVSAAEAGMILAGDDNAMASHIQAIYTKNPKCGRLHHLEPYIQQLPMSAYIYSKLILNTRWPEAEPVIATNYFAAYCYASDVIHGPWPEGEAAIRSKPMTSHLYDIFVLHQKSVWAHLD